MKGYYRRPSRAIEKGGGFYVPGLEGEKIRIITSGALVLMYIANRAGQTAASLPQVVSELTGISVALLLFAQGAADVFGLGGGVGATGSGAEAEAGEIALSATYLSVLQNNFGQDGRAGKGPVVEAVARSLVQTSEDALYIAALAGDGHVLFELGPVRGTPMSAALGREILGALAPFPRGMLALMPLEALQQRMSDKLTFLPQTTRSVGVIAAGEGMVWVLACGAAPEEVTPETRKWMQGLLGAPL